jgi:hypothetical protein
MIYSLVKIIKRLSKELELDLNDEEVFVVLYKSSQYIKKFYSLKVYWKRMEFVEYLEESLYNTDVAAIVTLEYLELLK